MASNADERARFEEVLAGVEHPRVGDVRAVWRRAADALPDLPPPEAGPHDGGGYFLGWNYTYAPGLTLTVIFPAAGGYDWFYRDKDLGLAIGTDYEEGDPPDPALPLRAFALLRVFALAKRIDETGADEGPRLGNAIMMVEAAAKKAADNAAVLCLASGMRDLKKRLDFVDNVAKTLNRKHYDAAQNVKRYKRALASSMRMLREARADVGAAKEHRVVFSEAEWAEVARVLDSPPEPSPELLAASRAARERIASPLGWGATPARVALWQAVNAYAAACGGDTSAATVSGARMDAVAAVERAVEGVHLRAADEVMRICEARPPTEPVAPVPEHVMRYGREVVATRIAHGICPRATCARHDGHEGPHASDDELRAAYAGPAASLPSDPSWGTCEKCARGEDHPQDGHCDLCNRVGRPLTNNTCDPCGRAFAEQRIETLREERDAANATLAELRKTDHAVMTRMGEMGDRRIADAELRARAAGEALVAARQELAETMARVDAERAEVQRRTADLERLVDNAQRVANEAKAELRGAIEGNGGEHPAWMAARHKYEQSLEHAEREARDRLACLRELYKRFGPLNDDGDVWPRKAASWRQMRELVAEAIGPEACAAVARENDWPGAEGGGDADDCPKGHTDYEHISTSGVRWPVLTGPPPGEKGGAP